MVTKEAARDVSYMAHYSRNDSKEFNGIKTRLTNTITAGGGILPAWVQVLGFTEDEMPSDK